MNENTPGTIYGPEGHVISRPDTRLIDTREPDEKAPHRKPPKLPPGASFTATKLVVRAPTEDNPERHALRRLHAHNPGRQAKKLDGLTPKQRKKLRRAERTKGA